MGSDIMLYYLTITPRASLLSQERRLGTSQLYYGMELKKIVRLIILIIIIVTIIMINTQKYVNKCDPTLKKKLSNFWHNEEIPPIFDKPNCYRRG